MFTGQSQDLKLKNTRILNEQRTVFSEKKTSDTAKEHNNIKLQGTNIHNTITTITAVTQTVLHLHDRYLRPQPKQPNVQLKKQETDDKRRGHEWEGRQDGSEASTITSNDAGHATIPGRDCCQARVIFHCGGGDGMSLNVWRGTSTIAKPTAPVCLDPSSFWCLEEKSSMGLNCMGDGYKQRVHGVPKDVFIGPQWFKMNGLQGI